MNFKLSVCQHRTTMEDEVIAESLTRSLTRCPTISEEPEQSQDDTDRISFTAEGHSSRLLKRMASLRKQGYQLCDVVLELGTKKIPAHRVVLSACSNYFCAMFTNRMLESTQEIVTLTDLDEEAVEELVNFAYTSNIDIHEDNVQPLLKAASILQLSEVMSACSAFLSQQLHPSNCLGIANFAEVHGCSELTQSAQEYILDHFPEVVQSDEYLQLGVEGVKQLMSSDCIRVHCEEEVFEAMHRWLVHNVQEREKYASELLSCIRLPLLKPLYLTEQVYSKKLYGTKQCVELVMNTMVYHTVKEKRAQLKGVINDLPRKGSMGTLFAIGGMDSYCNKGSIEYFNARKNHWKLISRSPVACRRLQFGVAVLSSKIYVVGGRNGLRTLNSVDCYNPVTNSWESITPMCSYRHGVSVGVMCGPMYAVGGHDGWSYLCSVER